MLYAWLRFCGGLQPTVHVSYSRCVLANVFVIALSPLAPTLLRVSDTTKNMVWPLEFARPGQDTVQASPELVKRAKEDGAGVSQVTIPERVVAVGCFSQASTEAVVRTAQRDLLAACRRDGLVVADGDDNALEFAQYDAIFSMGKRRGEVWVELENDKHPWSS